MVSIPPNTEAENGLDQSRTRQAAMIQAAAPRVRINENAQTGTLRLETSRGCQTAG